MAKRYEVAVLGCTPAGLAAAIELALVKRNVVVVGAPAAPTESPLADWVPADLFEQVPHLKSCLRAASAKPFNSVTFHAVDMERSAEYRSKKPCGYLLPAGKLVTAFKAAARKAKVHFSPGCGAAPRVHLAEHQVHLEGKHTTTAELLLIAQDSPAAVIGELALPVRNVPDSDWTLSAVDVTWTAAQVRASFDDALHVVNLSERGRVGMFFAIGSTVHVRLICENAVPETPAEGLTSLISTLKEGGLLPASMPLGRIKAGVWRPPAGVALDLETHIAKRTLLIGTAGGFAGMITGQTIVPSIRSALVAADIADAALASSAVQDVLGSYKTKWRKVLADGLRPPSTSLHLLLPLLFVNERMVPRFAKAMLYGDAI